MERITELHTTIDYQTLSMYHLRDTSLSWQAMGMLSFMLSCSERFKFSIEGLETRSKSGSACTRSALNELKEKGYVVVSRITDEKGRIKAWKYDIYEKPQDAGFSHAENPDVENPHVENIGQSNIINKENISTKENTIKVTPLSPKGKSHKVLDISFVDREDYIPIMEEWLAYKKEKGQTYKPTGLRTCYKKLVEYSNGNAEKAKQIIEEAMSNNYSGFFPLKQQSNGNNTGNRQTSIQYGNPLYEQMFAEMERNGYEGNY